MSLLKNVLIQLWLPVVVIAIWWFVSAGSTSPNWPPLSEILTTFREQWFFERFESDLVPSVARFFGGFIIAVAVGVSLGLLLGMSPRLNAATQPLVDAFRSLPKPALVPILIVILGLGSTMKVFIIAFSALWPILLNTVDGVRSLDFEKDATARVYGVKGWRRLFKIVLPAASPQIFAGLRLSLGIALIMMIISEMLASTEGLGFVVLFTQQTFAITEMWAGIIMIGILGFVANLILTGVEWRMLAWYRGYRALQRGTDIRPKGAKRRAQAA